MRQVPRAIKEHKDYRESKGYREYKEYRVFQEMMDFYQMELQLVIPLFGMVLSGSLTTIIFLMQEVILGSEILIRLQNSIYTARVIMDQILFQKLMPEES